MTLVVKPKNKFLILASSDDMALQEYFKQTQKITADACGVSYTTVRRVCTEGYFTGDVSDSPQTGQSFNSPRKTYKRRKYATELDDFDSDVIRRTVHEFYEKGEYPISKLILNSVQQKFDYKGSLASMKRLCNDGRRFLMERNDIVALRCKFLRTMCTLRKNNDSRPVIYLDETWETKGLKVPTGKGGRLIVCHAGSSHHGFIKEAKLIFRSKSGNTEDYYSQMNADVFRSWFEQLLQSLEEPCVIVMDNAPYHSMLEDNFPKSNARKANIQEWLTKKKINFSPLETIAELREKVKVLIPTEKNTNWMNLPLKWDMKLYDYHHITATKRQVASKNTTFKIADVEKLMHEAIDSVKKENWENCVRHAEKIQDEDYKKEKHREVILEPIILTIRPGDTSSDEDDEEDDII
ncbi:hypothetical protein AGLY_016856 [Aphis glycines]|uniref:Tc1-like transposase DDE domain-containing protein n=1 Tax=Aphis glycines TaxID=307491 RepID=A0A6G0SYL2_APHGL|nr:hypothetical protein AGLY_016856 [Aphis glycines]